MEVKMQVTKAEFVKNENEKDWYRVIIVSTEEPSALDIDGSDVDGMADDHGVAAGSVLIAPASNYIALEDGVFTMKSSGGGGGGGTTVTTGLQSISVSGIDPVPLVSIGEYTPPFEYDGEERIILDFQTDAAIDELETYTVTVTPGSGWYAYQNDAGMGEQGQPLTFDVLCSTQSSLEFGFVVVADPSDETMPFMSVDVHISAETPK